MRSRTGKGQQRADFVERVAYGGEFWFAGTSDSDNNAIHKRLE
jgi:hypothetical protein